MKHILHLLISLFGRLFAKQKLSILIYHQVLEEHDGMRLGEPTAKQFSWQMALLAKYFTPISLNDALQALKTKSLPKNAVCITFDDGYIDNLILAAPILKRFDIPATIYIATSFSSGENMFNDRIIDLMGDNSLTAFNLSAVELGQQKVDDEQARRSLCRQVIGKVKYLTISERKRIISRLYADNKVNEYPRKMMTELQIKELSEFDIDIGAHTVDHPILKTLTSEEQKKQIIQSKLWLENLIEKPVSNFAFPNGKLDEDYSLETVRLVEEAGFSSAVSTNIGVSNSTTDGFQLNRFTPWDNNPIKFHLRLLRNQINI